MTPGALDSLTSGASHPSSPKTTRCSPPGRLKTREAHEQKEAGLLTPPGQRVAGRKESRKDARVSDLGKDVVLRAITEHKTKGANDGR